MAAISNGLASLVVLTPLWATLPAEAFDPRYPDWPCQQLKAPHFSVAAVWTGPPIESADKQLLAGPKDTDLVARLAARRTPIEEARKLIDEFVVGTKAERQAKGTALFSELFSVLDAQRDEVMNGIERFTRKEKAMAEDIRTNTRKLQQQQDAANSDQAAIEQLASQVEWETRIFEDRRKSTSYVCEVPVLIEKRLFDLARTIQDATNADP